MIAIAEIKGEMKAIHAENDAMESRIDASLAQMRVEMAGFREDAAKRDKENQRWMIWLVLACTAIVVGTVALL